jgi:hypothetical protein
MKRPNEPSRVEPANPPHANSGNPILSGKAGGQFHPVRRASDNCPLSRIPFSSEDPPTSPKIHELRERNAAQQAADARLRSLSAK